MQIPGPVSRHAAAEFRNPAEPGRLVRIGGALHGKRFGESGITPGQDLHGFSGPAHDRRIAARRAAFQERFEPSERIGRISGIMCPVTGSMKKATSEVSVSNLPYTALRSRTNGVSR